MASEDREGVWISSALLSQFSSTWKMLREAIENCPDEYWYGTDKEWNYSRTVYHLIETQEFYFRNSPNGMEWGKLLGDVENKDLPADAVYPAKGILLGYLEDMEKKITTHLKTITFDEMLNKDNFKWFSSVLEKYLYLLRHNAHHLGELARMLREWECQRMKWQ